ncbi:BQ2448_7225 [Microbotryum intermedium]|uniref:BQ2448_7225 protein n=1 Tax=Microbotryum intermedium TaxID=269621 RepID=A0A238FKH5_9BASI|nr:BQ2448_7225 [Microbotryum intermedium]
MEEGRAGEEQAKGRKENRSLSFEPMMEEMVDYAVGELENSANCWRKVEADTNCRIRFFRMYQQSYFDPIYSSDHLIIDNLRSSLLSRNVKLKHAMKIHGPIA